MLWLVSLSLFAQTLPKDSIQKAHLDSLTSKIVNDTQPMRVDSLPKADTKGMDSLQITNENGDIEAIIYYQADDSIMMDVPNKKAYLYGKAKIKYQDMQLDADKIEIEWDKNIISAKGKVDSTGKYIGYPVWKQGADVYVTDSMKYNMNSKKGIIHGIATKQGEGILTSSVAKRTEEAIYLKDGRYSTCDLKHPHFYINAKKIKVIPNDKAVCGPFNLVIEDIQTPIGFWMGFFPITDKKKSGIIIPTFGENALRGIFIQHGGYYWAINDYIGAELTGDVYANGSYLVNLKSTYLKRYKYKGTVDAGISKVKDGFDPNLKASSQFRLVWTHSTTAKRNGNFTSSVNLSSSKYGKQNFNTPIRNENITTSSVTYSRVFGRTPFSTSISMRANQNNFAATASNANSAIYNVTLPAASLTMASINPLKRKYGDGNKWFEKIFVNYQGNFNYDFTNRQKIYDSTSKQLKDSTLQINQDNFNRYILPNALWASTHTASIRSTFKFLKYFNANPSVTYFENWHSKKYSYTAQSNNAIKSDTTNGFYRTSYFNTAMEVNTRIYGTLQFKGNGLIKGIRHTANPSIKMTYAPDFTKISSGGWVEVPGVVDKKGETQKSFLYPTNQTPAFQQTVVDFTLSNILEAKVRNRKDTSGTNAYKKTNLLDNLSITGGYNFGADSLRMKPVALNARTKLFNRFDITYNSSYDPYFYFADSIKVINGKKTYYGERQTNTYLFNSNNGRLAQLSNMNLTIGTRLAPKQKTKKDPKFDNPQMQAELDYIRANPAQYIDFNIPWSLGLNFTYSYLHKGLQDPVTTQTLVANGDLSLTPKLKITYSTGYNFKEKTITYSNFTIYRDLHCWQMSMSLSPFGSFRTFSFSISAKASMLQQLKVNKRSPTFIQ